MLRHDARQVPLMNAGDDKLRELLKQWRDIEPAGRLMKEDLAGLPLPERLWE